MLALADLLWGALGFGAGNDARGYVQPCHVEIPGFQESKRADFFEKTFFGFWAKSKMRFLN